MSKKSIPPETKAEPPRFFKEGEIAKADLAGARMVWPIRMEPWLETPPRKDRKAAKGQP